MKAVSPLVSTILVIAIIVVIAGMLGPWALNFAGRKVNNTQTDTENRITCQNTAYDFDTSYGNSGTEWDFSGTNDYLRVKIINTGSVNLHSFSFQIYIQGAGYQFFPVKNEITPDNPLKPTQSTIIEANISGDLVGSLTEVRILNGVCKTFSLMQEF
jgi:flagellin-like protein